MYKYLIHLEQLAFLNSLGKKKKRLGSVSTKIVMLKYKYWIERN